MYTNEKANSFINIIRRNAELERKRLISEANSTREEEVRSAEKAAIEQARRLVSAEKASIIKNASADIASAEVSYKKEFLIRRAQMIDEIFLKAKNKLIDYRKSSDYENLLIRVAEKIEKAYPDKECTVLLGAFDTQHKEKIESIIKNSHAELCDDIAIGGMRVIFESDNIMLDETLDSRLEEARENFSHTDELSAI